MAQRQRSYRTLLSSVPSDSICSNLGNSDDDDDGGGGNSHTSTLRKAQLLWKKIIHKN